MSTLQKSNQAAPDNITRVEARSSYKPVTARSFIIGLVIALAICVITPYNDEYIAATRLGGNYFPTVAFGALLLIVLFVNPILISLGKRDKMLTPAEMFTIWAINAVAAGIPGGGLMRTFIPSIVGPHYYANASNGWETTILSHISPNLLVTDKAAIKGYYEGIQVGAPIPWGAWVTPILSWSILVVLIYTAFVFLAALYRKQWVENERLAFPMLQLPLMFCEAPEEGQRFNSIVRSPLLWISVVLVTIVHTVRGMHQLWPASPDITLQYSLNGVLVNKPWSYLSNIGFNIWWLVIGITFLVPTEVAFSLWFFYLATQVESMMCQSAGIQADWSGMGPIYLGHQEAGGAIALLIWVFWAMRKHLRDVFRKAFLNDPEVDDTQEPVPYRALVLGLLAVFTGIFCWLTFVAEIDIVMSVVIMCSVLMVFTLISWLVAQAGLLFAGQAFSLSDVTLKITGTMQYTPKTLALTMMTDHIGGWFDARENISPTVMHTYKGSKESGLSVRSMTWVIGVTVLLTMFLSTIAWIWMPYTHGGAARMGLWTFVNFPQSPFQSTQGYITSPKGANMTTMWNVLGGMVFVFILFICRSIFPAFNLHPAGFLLGDTYPMWSMWFSVFLGWVFKIPVMRYGGIKLYRKVLPFFLGLIVADIINSIIWVIVGIATRSGYNLTPP